MNRIAESQASEQLTTAIEANLFAWIPVFGKLGCSPVNDPPGVRRSITDLPISLFNSVMDARLTSEQMDAAIRAISSDASTRNVPVLWWISPSTRPVDLGKHLESYGFVYDEYSPGMAADLEKLPETLPMPGDLHIELAQGDASWRQWSILMQLGFGAASANELSVKAWCDILHQSDPGMMKAYTGWLGDHPVATSLLFLAGGAAGIYSVATIPEARRKGIGTIMTWHSLQQARSMGYKIGTLQSSEMGIGVYRSLGFQEYCRIDTYLWKPGLAGAG